MGKNKHKKRHAAGRPPSTNTLSSVSSLASREVHPLLQLVARADTAVNTVSPFEEIEKNALFLERLATGSDYQSVSFVKAAEIGSRRMVALHLIKAEDISSYLGKNSSAFSKAVEYERLAVLITLLAAYSDDELRKVLVKNEHEALNVAIYYKYTMIIEILLFEYKRLELKPPTLPSDLENSALKTLTFDYLTHKNNERRLLYHEREVFHEFTFASPSFQYAVQHGSRRMVTEFLINAEDSSELLRENGHEALRDAVKYGQTHVVITLLVFYSEDDNVLLREALRENDHEALKHALNTKNSFITEILLRKYAKLKLDKPSWLATYFDPASASAPIPETTQPPSNPPPPALGNYLKCIIPCLK